MKPQDTSYEEVVRVFERTASGSQLLGLTVWPKHACTLAHMTKWAAFFGVFSELGDRAPYLINYLYNKWPSFDSTFVRAFAQGTRSFTLGDETWVVGRLGTYTVMWAHHFAGNWVWAPLPLPELLSSFVGGPTRVTHVDAEQGLSVTPDDDPPPLLDDQTREIIGLTKQTPGPRSWLLYGPPGGGKTTAARQIAREIGEGAWVTLDAQAIGSPAAWELVHSVKPRALILDEVDSASERALLANLTRARAYAKVIVQTANVVSGLRGALKRTGRTDERPRLFDRCNVDAARVCAPTIPRSVLEDAVARGLLHSYFAELEVRHRGGRDLNEAIEELLERQQEIGER